jgi:uncharacterized protein (TIGR02246 family)
MPVTLTSGFNPLAASQWRLIMKRIALVPFVLVALNLIPWAQSQRQMPEAGLSKTMFSAVAPVAPTESAGEDFKTEMQKMVEAWKEAFNSNDMEKLAAMYSEDAVMIDEDGVIAGRTALRDSFTKFRVSGASMSSITVDRAERSGDIGYLTDVWTEAAPKSGGGTEMLEGYSLIVLKHVGNKWLITAHAAIAKQK